MSELKKIVLSSIWTLSVLGGFTFYRGIIWGIHKGVILSKDKVLIFLCEAKQHVFNSVSQKNL